MTGASPCLLHGSEARGQGGTTPLARLTSEGGAQGEFRGHTLCYSTVSLPTAGADLSGDVARNDPDLGFSRGDRPDSRFHGILSLLPIPMGS